MMNKKESCGALILAAGKSCRMGESKLYLPFNEKITFIEKVLSVFSEFNCSEIVVVINEFDAKKIPEINTHNAKFVLNYKPDLGRFYSVKLGFNNFIYSDYIFLHNVDNPLINTEILNKLYINRDKEKYISPFYQGKGGHPILLPKSIFTQIHTQNTKNLNLRKVLQPFPRKNVLINSNNVLININTKKDYNKYIKI